MMSRFYFSILWIFIGLVAEAQPNIYSAYDLTADLKINASSVKREEKITFEVRAKDKAYYKVHKVVTILNEAGKNELIFYKFTDKFFSLEEVAIEIFDSRGISKKKYTRDDLSKQSAGEGLVPDGKIYYLVASTLNFPVTIQTDYELKYNGILNYPDYELQLPEQSVENSVFSAKVPADLDLRYKPKNTAISPVITTDGKYKVYTWTVKNLPAMEYEEGTVSRQSRYPQILISPNKFELDGYEGDMTSWKNFGYWYGSLAKDALNLSEERKLFFRNLVKNASTDREKAALIYTYLQQNCRYVLISLGIGGFKPFEAAFVDKKKYGDCKALSNYTQSCLAAVGIKSYQALINAEYNQEPVDPDFPYNGFNHVILCLPLQGDSVWMECTSTTNEFGVLGSFTENRNALLITEDGGKLVPTPRSKATENTFSAHTVINLKEDGTGTAKIMLGATGEYRQDFLHYILNEKKDEQKNYLVNDLGFIQPDEFDLNLENNSRITKTKLDMNIEKIPDFTAGSKMFLHPRIYKLWGYALPKKENRVQDFYFEHPFVKSDTTIYELPAGYGIETLPKAKELKFEYGTYSTSYSFDESKKTITSIAKLVLTEYKIPVAKYAAAKTFFDDVLAEYNQKIVVKKL